MKKRKLTIIITLFCIITISNVYGKIFFKKINLKLNPEDPLVLEWLKVIQDTSSPEGQLLSSMEDNIAHTFNNSLAAMCFILKDEKERAERILDFYSNATDIDNTNDQKLQNFYYNGETRGFYQSVALTNAWEGFFAYHALDFQNDRWIGDMAWLLLAYKYYEKKYNDTSKYKNISFLIKSLLISFYKDYGGGEGYIQHGWRRGDSYLHEKFGHYEGNIDCYAVLKLCGDNEYTEKIKKWLDLELKGLKTLPIDLYTWRVMAFGEDYAYLLDIPEDKDKGFKKTVLFNNKTVTGFFSGSSNGINNIWIDGTGHMACAFMAVGQKYVGYYYANQLDNFLIERIYDDKLTKSLPYTANKEGGYDWVNTEKGFTSCAVWYIFSKNEFNPLLLTQGNPKKD